MKIATSQISVAVGNDAAEPAIIPTLLRIPMSLMVAFSTLAGYLAFPGPARIGEAIRLTIAVFLLAAGCSALNQAQERREDARMVRTRRRPLPSGRIAVVPALIMAGMLIVGGLLLLARLEHPVAGWGVGALLLYNGLYTWLKQRTSFALLIGAICGSLPPLMGWCAAGGHPAAPPIVAFAALFWLWQVPHTWALYARFPADHTSGPFTSLFRYVASERLQLLSRVWLAALTVATLSLPVVGLVRTPLCGILCLCLAGGLAVLAIRPGGWAIKACYKGLTLYMTMLIGLVVCERLLF